MDTISQSIFLLEFLITGMAPLVEAAARREIREYIATTRFRRWAQHTLLERGKGAVIARIPRRLKPGRTSRNRSHWRPEGYAVTRDIEEMRAAKTESCPDVTAITAHAEAAYARAIGRPLRRETQFFGTKLGRVSSLPPFTAANLRGAP